MRLLSIDPGPTESAYVIIDTTDCQPLSFGKISNHELRNLITTAPDWFEADKVVIEMIASYGMSVGAEVFDTCVWIGRFSEAVRGNWWPWTEPALIKRLPVKVYHCKSAKATDANIAQALKDRFAKGVRNHGKGTKAEPGFFYGFHSDVWAAFALAVYAADQEQGGVW